jgi:murein DD-endopeptidase MepM/ murein hydrolase activator NlpD
LRSKKISFLIVPENTSNVKQVKCSRGFLAVIACFLVVGLAGVGYVFHDYFTLKAMLPSMGALADEVTNQRAQLQLYAQKIRALNSEMETLHSFEKKIRVIANVETSAEQDAVFGIGGTLDEDLDTLPALSDSHANVVRAMHANLEQLEEASIVQKRAFSELHDYLQDQRSLLASTPAVSPTTGWVSSGFGYRISPFTGHREFHRGMDIATRAGTIIVAPADGVVTFTGIKGGLGKMMVIDHGYGKVTRYGHLSDWKVKAGKKVKRGDTIALVGNTGRSTAPHLHYEVHVNGIPVNPAKYILD